MAGSIERLWRLIPRHQAVPVAMLVIGAYATPDPTRRPSGYTGVVQVPSAPATGKVARPDPLLEQQRRDIRVSRGRVLYAPGHAPAPSNSQATTPSATPAKNAQKIPCPIQRVGQAHPVRTSPSL